MAGTMGGAMNLDGGDPRMNSSAGVGFGVASEITRPTARKLHDPSVTFEEYMHYAAITRADDRNISPHTDNALSAAGLKSMNPFAKKRKPAVETVMQMDEKTASSSPDRTPYIISEEEYIQASRAVRTATWGAVFFLITTDILGPFSTAWAFRQMGYGPGAVLYTIFAAFAGYGGFLLWKMFLGLDSDKYPLRTYGDIAFRVYGQAVRIGVNFLQSFQLLFNVGIIIITNGQSLSQMAAKGPKLNQNGACFIVLCFVWALAGMLLGQIRTLARLGHLANFAIWLNVIVIIATMAVVAHSSPNYVAANTAYMIDPGPVITTAGPPAEVKFQGQIVGLMQAVYSYGGAMLFVEFMAEMRRPFDFWKGMLCAQTFIYIIYMLFGLFVYSYQGQFTLIIAYQGISSYAWQTVANAFGLTSGLIAALLYGNIGIKVIYNNVLMELFRFPTLGTKAGKLAWIGVVPVYWAIAFILAAAIPQVANLSGFIAAACILQFSYTFPPFLHLGFQIQKAAIQSGEGFDPATGQTVRHDNGMKRYIRGFKMNIMWNSFHVFFFLGSFVTAILGIYSAILGMITSYATGATSTFSCNSPVL
ncbi:hypothetical protein N7G274_004462 [Stereocaulon virgatum]|uniref:Amino acid transporter transmembrane domain-containing protein n=1 Tax=Stereocaulon virgatum TaxID=373712 RepID=A0ABR4AAF1_9LECA